VTGGRLTAGTLFSGIDGFGLALERAGFQIRWQAEVELEERGPRKGQPKRRQRNQEVLARHFPSAHQLGDVRSVNRATAEPVDLIAGGFPCQDVSIAGRRAGLAGARSGLWWEFHRVLAELLPRWVLVENTPGLLSSNDGRDMGAVLGALADLGYGYAYRVLDAQHFGLAQRRQRLFIACHLGAPWGAPAQVLLEPDRSTGDPAPRRQTAPVAAALTARGAGGGRGPGGVDDNDARGGRLVVGPLLAGSPESYRIGAEEAANGHLIANALTAHHAPRNDPEVETFVVVADTISAGCGNGRRQEDDRNLVAHTLTAEGADGSEDGTGRGTPLVIARTLRADPGGTGQAHNTTYIAGTLRSHPRPGSATPGAVVVTPLRANGAGGSHGAGIGEPGDPAPTLDTTDSAAIAFHQTQDPISIEDLAPALGAKSSGMGVFRKSQRAHHPDDGESWVADDLARTLDAVGHGPRTAQAVLEEEGVRRLTPLECERLQGFPDGWTERSLSGRRCAILVRPCDLNAWWPGTTVPSSTEPTASASCTTSGSGGTEVSTFRSDLTKLSNDAPCVIGWLERTEPAAGAHATTSRGSATATHSRPSATSPSGWKASSAVARSTDAPWRLCLVGPSDAARRSTISTWIRETTRLRTSTSAPTPPTADEYTVRWNAQPPSWCAEESWAFRMASTSSVSDSPRYRMLGNAVPVPVVEWIARRIVACEAHALIDPQASEVPA
jgi:DNA (cytosine-5)-methyltransferase 1